MPVQKATIETPKFVEIACFLDLEEARCAISYLASHDILSHLQNEHHLSAAPYLCFALGGGRLMALAEQEEDARDLLSVVNQAATRRAASNDTEHCCDVCGSNNVRRQRNLYWIAVAYFTSTPFVPYNGRTECLECGHIRNEKK